MATTAGEILERVQALGYGTDISAPQLKALNMLHKRIVNTRRWRFLGSVESSLTTSVGVGEYTVDTLADTKRIDAVRLRASNGDAINLEHQEQATVRDFTNLFPENGTPQYWVQIGAKLHIWPKPDKAYSILVDVVDIPTELTESGKNVQIPDSHADILVWGTIMGITFRERDWEGHNFSRQMYAELLAEMQAQFGMSDRQTPKTVANSGFHDSFNVDSPWLS